MCGIAGWIDYKNSLIGEDTVMAKLSETLAKRGPDARGEWKTTEAYIVHRRLIVVDPDNGKQPMVRQNRGKKYILTYNGELYNTEDIRAKLLAQGYRFEGHSDTEVLLTAYIEWGENFLEELNGIYAFGIWNDTDKSLFLARDRIGVKPLFYHHYDGGIIFGSEIKTLLAHPYIKPEIDEQGIASIMLLGPARKLGNGVFKNINELKPGFFAKIDSQGMQTKSYWKLTAKAHKENPYETADHVRSLVTDSIKRQLVSDVPLCTFLSGGLDSSLISTIAAGEFIKKGEVLSTFSLDFKDNRQNFTKSIFQPDEDAPWIERMSEFVGSKHNNFVLDTLELADALDTSTIARDLPGMADVDSSLHLLCQKVREGFIVGISGECADELFAGYPWYHNHDILFENGFPWSRSTADRANLLKDGVLKGIAPQEFVQDAYDFTVSKTDYLDTDSKIDRRMREMFMLNFYWFMQNLLERKDRLSMENGLEVRVPFCDHRIAEYAYNIPWEIKAFKGREKGILRQAASELLPHDVVWRKKSPYPKTHNPNYMQRVLGDFKKVLDTDARIYELLDREKLVELYESGGKSFVGNWFGQLMSTPQLFAYLTQLEFWLNHYDVKIV